MIVHLYLPIKDYELDEDIKTFSNENNLNINNIELENNNNNTNNFNFSSKEDMK